MSLGIFSVFPELPPINFGSSDVLDMLKDVELKFTIDDGDGMNIVLERRHLLRKKVIAIIDLVNDPSGRLKRDMYCLSLSGCIMWVMLEHASKSSSSIIPVNRLPLNYIRHAVLMDSSVNDLTFEAMEPELLEGTYALDDSGADAWLFECVRIPGVNMPGVVH